MRWPVALLVVCLLVSVTAGPARAAGNAAPVAVDDPDPVLCNSDAFGGSFPIAEDWLGTDPDHPGWAVLYLGCGPLANDTDPDADPLTLAEVDTPSHGQVQWTPDGLLLYKPDADYSTVGGDAPGEAWVSDSITYRASDGTELSNTATYRLWIAPINDPPSFTPGPDIVTGYVGGPVVSEPWASDISPGPDNEASQRVAFDVLSVDDTGAPGMFAVPPAIDANGVLTFTPGAEPGLATVTVQAHDDGGLEDYGLPHSELVPPDDTSDPVTFTIVVTRDDEPPTMGALGRSLPAQRIGASTVKVHLSWSASDAISGVAGYELQEGVNGGSYHSVALPSATSTGLTRTVRVGAQYRYRVRATDGDGNTSAWATWSPFTPRRWQDATAHAAWRGPWWRAVDGRLSGGRSRRTSSTTSRVTLTFTGHDIGWVGTRSAHSGRAQVRIDGVLVATVSLRGTTGRFRHLAFRMHLDAGGTHRLQIRPIGSGRIDVDAFVVIP